MTKDKDITLISAAAANATAAASAAATAAASAAENARLAAKAAAESATAIAVVATDTSWMKKSLSGIEVTLEEMRNQFVTAPQHADVIKTIDSQEERLKKLEEKTNIWVGGLAVLTFAIPLILKFFVK